MPWPWLWLCLWPWLWATAAGEVDAAAAAAGCPAGCECGSAEGELEYTCRTASATYALRALPNDFVRIFCQEGELKCAEMPLIPLSDNGTLASVGMTGCALPPLGCVLRRFGAAGAGGLTLKAARGPLTAASVRGLGPGLTMLAMFEAAAQTEIPFDAIAALPSLRDFRLQDASLSLSAGAGNRSESETDVPPHPSLKFVSLMSVRVDGLGPASLRRLRGLEQLSLWNNNITNLTSDSFIGLESLQQLEVSRNPLRVLPPGVFSRTPRLARLRFVAARLELLPQGALGGLTLLKEILIKFNQRKLALGPRALADLPALQTVTIDHSELDRLPADLFAGDESLELLALTQAGLEALPPGLFLGLRRLRGLDLRKNRLQELSADIFWPLTSLRDLNLNDNQIVALPAKLFSGLKNLVTLKADNNRIAEIAPTTFVGASALENVSLASNRLTLSGDDGFQYGDVERQSPFNGLFKLRELVLRDNLISEVMSDWRLVLITNLQRLDLAGNNFTELTRADVQFIKNDIVVDLRRNRIATVDLFEAPDWLPRDLHRDPTGGRMLLDDNPFRCDCELVPLVRRLRGARPLTSEPRLEPGGARCAGPPAMAGRALAGLRARDLTCAARPADCPAACACAVRPAAARLELACDRPPARFPAPADFGVETTALRLRRPPGALAALPPHVTELDLAAVGLADAPDAPPTVRLLDLAGNELRRVPAALAANVTVRLAGNPLACDCAHADGVALLQRSAARVLDYENVTCAGGERAWRVDAARLCDVRRAAALGGALAALGLAAVALAAALYRYRLEARLLLFSRGWCARLARDDGPERDARYDAFVSFAQADARWVTEELVPRLEGAHGLRLCVHHRDWAVGEMIPAQIARSVEQSRRTIVVLSPHFLRSLWAPLEFRAAHLRAQRERRTRVLVVLLGDLPADSELDDELRAYVNTNTYLKWGDPWFWKKLLYALPPGRPGGAPLPDKLQRGALDVRVDAEGKIVNDAAPAL